jgi:NADH:ubiquinone oxidoreductase subunit 4 (subunit M)
MAREFLMLSLLAIAVLYMGVYPKPFTDVMDVSVANCSSMSLSQSCPDHCGNPLEIRD